MYRRYIIFTSFLSLCFLSIGNTYAEEKLNYEEALEIFSGNTIEGKITNFDVDYKMYLDSSGSFVRIFRGTTDKGNWRIKKNGRFCIELGQEKCRKVKKRDDGGYNAYNRFGDLKFTINKVLRGNPHKLQP